jgi:hypothetical protein
MTSDPDKPTVPDDSVRVEESEEAHPTILKPNASISGLSEEAVLNTLVGGESDDVTGLLDKEDVVLPMTENEELPPTTPEVEEREPTRGFKRKVCCDSVLRRMLRSNNRR